MQFSQRHPHHFIAAFADGTLFQINLFAEDPVMTEKTNGPWPWLSILETQETTKKPKRAKAGEEQVGDELKIWKNEEFGVLGDPKKGVERPAWSSKNPMEAFRIGQGSVSSQ